MPRSLYHSVEASRKLYVRVKRIGEKRYVYLVKGVRKGKRVRQKTLSYLGPLSKLASGIPEDARSRVEKTVRAVDWDKVNTQIRRIPLTFEELSEARRAQYSTTLATRQDGSRNPTRGGLPRAEGELSVLTRLATKRFNEMFQTVGKREYRMR